MRDSGNLTDAGADTSGGDLSSAPDPVRLELPPANPNEAAPLPLDLVLWGAGINVAVRSFFRRLFGWKRYRGDPQEICRQVVDACWTGEFFAGSGGHFKQFWTRDLAMCTPALCRMGLRDRVVQSLAWGLARFEKAGRITTTIFNGRFPRDVYAYGSDSLPMLLFALRAADATHLIDRHRALLAREIDRYVKTVFDPKLGMARTDGYFSGPRDCMTGRSTVFANTMIGLLIRLLDVDDRLPNPLAGHDMADLLDPPVLDGQLLPGLALSKRAVRRRQSLAVLLRGRDRHRDAAARLRDAGSAWLHPAGAAALLREAPPRGRAARPEGLHPELPGRSELDAARRRPISTF